MTNSSANRRYRILYLEDEQDLVTMIRIILNRQGYDVVGVESVSQALELIDRQAFDLVFVDLNLHQGSGWDLLDHLKDCAQYADVPKVIVSAQPPTHKRRQETGYGKSYNEVIAKPFRVNALLEVTQRLLGNGKSQYLS